VVPHGVDHARFRPADSGHDAETLGRLGVHAPYLLFVGTIEPRKAVPVLLDAFERVASERPEVALVLAGRPGWGVAPVERALREMRSRRRVVRLGYVADDAVPVLLRGAAAAVYPAMEEGFGLPALEALACGTPLVTTAGSTMAELARGAAALVAPGDVSELADAMFEALEGGSALGERQRRGLAIAAEHSWAASAAGHMSAYRWAASRRRPASPSPRGGS
jgi:glycosyltransferase involved in cell wall biosynthesis